MNFIKTLSILISILFVSPVNAKDMYAVKEVNLDGLGYKQPVFKQSFHDNVYLDQVKIGFYGDPDNFPFTSKKQGSIFYELFSDFFNDRHLFVEILYPRGNYKEELSKFENNTSDWDGVIGLYYENSKYSKNKYIYPAFAENGIHIITSKNKNLDIQNKEDLKKYKGVYAKDDKLEKSVIKDFSRYGIQERETFDYAIEDLLTDKVDFVVASYYRSQIKLYTLGLMNYVNYSLNPVWSIPMFLKVSPKVANSKNVSYIRQYFQTSGYKEKRDELLAKVLEIYKQNTKGVIPPTYTNALQTEVQE